MSSHCSYLLCGKLIHSSLVLSSCRIYSWACQVAFVTRWACVGWFSYMGWFGFSLMWALNYMGGDDQVGFAILDLWASSFG